MERNSSNSVDNESIKHTTSSEEQSPSDPKKRKIENSTVSAAEAKDYKPKSKKRLYEMWQQEKDDMAAGIFHDSEMADQYNTLKDLLQKKGIHLHKYFKWQEFENEVISKLDKEAKNQESPPVVDSTFDMNNSTAMVQNGVTYSPPDNTISTSVKIGEASPSTPRSALKRHWSMPDVGNQINSMNQVAVQSVATEPDSLSPNSTRPVLMPMRRFLLIYVNKPELKSLFHLGTLMSIKKPDDKNVDPKVCLVCSAPSTGLHYGRITCEGCKGFFKRAIQGRQIFECTGLNDNNCDIYSKEKRNVCKKCRFRKCLLVGMAPAAVRENHMPGGRNSQAVYNQDYSISDDEEDSQYDAQLSKTSQQVQDASRPTSQSFSAVPTQSVPDTRYVAQQPYQIPSFPYSNFTTTASVLNNFMPQAAVLPPSSVTSPCKAEMPRTANSLSYNGQWTQKPELPMSSSTSNVLDILARNPSMSQDFLRMMISQDSSKSAESNINLTKKAMLDEMISETRNGVKQEAGTPQRPYTIPKADASNPLPFLHNLMVPPTTLPSPMLKQSLRLPLDMSDQPAVTQTLKRMMSGQIMSNNANVQLPSMFRPQACPQFVRTPHHLSQIPSSSAIPPQSILNRRNIPTSTAYTVQPPTGLHQSLPNGRNIKQEDLHQPSILRNLIMPSPQDLCNTTSTVPSNSNSPTYSSVLENLMKGKDNLNIDRLSQCIENLEGQCATEESQPVRGPVIKSMSLLSVDDLLQLVKSNADYLNYQPPVQGPPFDVEMAYSKIVDAMTEKYGKLFGEDARLYMLLFNVSTLIHFGSFWAHSPRRGEATTKQSEVMLITAFIKNKLRKLAYIITGEIESYAIQISEMVMLLMTVSGDPQQVFQTVLSAYLQLHQNGTVCDQKLVRDMNETLQAMAEMLPKIHPFLIMTINRVCASFDVRTD